MMKRMMARGGKLRDLFVASRDPRPKLAYVGGWLGKQNLGDETLFAACQVLLPEFRLIHYDGGRISHRGMRSLGDLKGGILAGGTLIGQSRSWYHAVERFMELGIKFAVMGSGVADRRFWPDEPGLREWARLLDGVSTIGVRGPISAEYLRGVGMKNTVVCGDPVLAFCELGEEPEPERKVLGLNFGCTPGRMYGDDDRIFAELVKLASMARGEGWSVVWYVVWPKDLQITRRAAEEFGGESRILEFYSDHQGFIESTRKLTVFVGMKLHATVLATCGLTPSIMLEYRTKCRDYMASIGQSEQTFCTSEFVAEEVWDEVTNLSKDRPRAVRKLKDGISRLHRTQQDFAASVRAAFLSC